MSAKKSDFGLIIKLLVALAIGAFLGRMANVEVMDAVASVKYALGQIIFYAVPLVIVGFITPAIARLGQNASKMLLTAVAIAYLSSVGAAAFSAASGYAIIPHLSVPTEVSGLVDLPKPSFVLDIPPLMSVMSALVTALLLGLAVSWTKAEIINKALAELEAIMTSVVTRVIIPILPFFVGATFCELSYEGRLTVQFPIFLKVIGIVIVGHFIWLAVLYSIGGILSGRNPWRVLRYYLPAYLTAVRRHAARGPVLRAALPGPEQDRHGIHDPLGRDRAPVRLRADRNLFRHDHQPDAVRHAAVRGYDGLLHRAVRHLRRGCPRRARRDGHGLARPRDERAPFRSGGRGPAAGHLRFAGQFRHGLQRDRGRGAGHDDGRDFQP